LSFKNLGRKGEMQRQDLALAGTKIEDQGKPVVPEDGNNWKKISPRRERTKKEN